MITHVVRRVELYPGQRAAVIDELGPGYRGAVALVGVLAKLQVTDLHAGDILVG